MITKLSDKRKDEIIDRLKKFRTDAEEGNKPTFKRMSKAERFKVGKQWDREDLEYNKHHRKHSLTINRVLPIVLQIDGNEIQNPRDMNVQNLKGGTATIARIFTALAKHTMDSSHGREVKSEVFDEGVTTGRGWIGAEMDYSTDPMRGDVRVKKYDAFMVLLDPNCTQYDINAEIGGAQYLIVDEWENKVKIELQYPDKKLSLESADYTYASNAGKGRYARIISALFRRSDTIGIKDDYREDSLSEDTPETSQAKYNYRVSTTWWKEYKEAVYLQSREDPLNYVILEDPKEIARVRKRIAEYPDPEKVPVRLIEKDRKGKPLVIGLLRKTDMVGDVLLEHDDNPLDGVNLFPLVRYAPYFVNGYEFGVVENLVSSQEEVNWARSMALNLVKLLANAGWKVGRAGAVEQDFLKAHGGEDGVVLDESKFGNKIEKLEPQQIPTQYEYIVDSASKHMHETANVRLEEPVRDQKQLSGRAIALKQQASFTGSALLHSHYDRTIRIFGELLVELISKTDVYSDEEITAVVDEEDLIDAELFDNAKGLVLQSIRQMGREIPEVPERPNRLVLQRTDPRLQGAIIEQYQKEMKVFEQCVDEVEAAAKPLAVKIILKLLRSKSLGRYGIKVDLAPMAATFRIIKSLEMSELNKNLLMSGHLPISRKRLILASDVANKEEIAEEEPEVPPMQPRPPTMKAGVA